MYKSTFPHTFEGTMTFLTVIYFFFLKKIDQIG
jgi:hypothetical protein